MKFEAKKIDLELELVTLDGETLTLTPKKLVTATETVVILEQWTKLESAAKTNVQRVKLAASELSILYPREADWFMNNFDMGTLNEVLNYVAGAIGGIRKNVESSN